jgi:restriction system protein
MAKSRSLWTELQRERAQRQRLEQQQRRDTDRVVAREIRTEQQALRAAARATAANEKERKRLYVEDRKAEAASMTSQLQARMVELDSVLTSGIRLQPDITFPSLKQAGTADGMNGKKPSHVLLIRLHARSTLLARPPGGEN